MQLADGEDNTDEELAVDDYLVQNIELSELIESPEVLTMKRRRGELEAQEENKIQIQPLKTERPSTYVLSNNNQNPTERGNPGKRQKGGPDVRP